MVANERSQMRFSDVCLLDLPKCLWSVSQCLTTRVCGPWYWSPQLLRSNCYLPMDSLVGMSIEEVKIYTSHELGTTKLISTLDCLWKLLFLTISPPPSHSISPEVPSYLWWMLLRNSIFSCQWDWPKLYECTYIYALDISVYMIFVPCEISMRDLRRCEEWRRRKPMDTGRDQWKWSLNSIFILSP